MPNTNETDLGTIIDLSIAATEILAMPLWIIQDIEETAERALDANAYRIAVQHGLNLPNISLLAQYLDLMQDHSAPNETKFAVFLYLMEHGSQVIGVLKSKAQKGEGDAARTGKQGSINVEGTLARSD
jgi:hypothetical protein